MDPTKPILGNDSIIQIYMANLFIVSEMRNLNKTTKCQV